MYKRVYLCMNRAARSTRKKETNAHTRMYYFYKHTSKNFEIYIDNVPYFMY